MNLKTILFYIAIFAQMVYSQSSILEISTEKISANDVNWDATLSFTSAAALQSGFVLELPAAVHMVPIAVTVNDQDLWLQNGTQAAQVDSVVTWYSGSQGLVFMFNPSGLGAADRLQIRMMTTLHGKRADTESAIRLRAYNAGQVSAAVIDSVALPAAWRTNKK
jgi:hypothetical protein